MKHESIYRFTIDKFMKANLVLPGELKELVKKFENAMEELSKQPREVQEKYTPVIVKAAAVIAAELQKEYDKEFPPDTQEPEFNVDKLKMLQLKARALLMLEKDSENQK